MAINSNEYQIEQLQMITIFIKIVVFVLTLLVSWVVITSPATAAGIAFNESMTGERNIAQNFTFTMSNVSGSYADCVYQYTVYDYREIGENITHYSVNWGQWYKQEADPGKKYIAVWVRGMMQGTSYIGWGQDFFTVWVWGNQSYQPEPVLMQDIEIGSYKRYGKTYTKTGCNEYTAIDDLSVSDTWDENRTGRRLPAVIRDVENLKATNERGQLSRERYGWKDENEQDRMVPGEMWEGYILYQIPESATAADIQIAGNFRAAGAAIWNIRDRDIIQDSEEKYRYLESVQMQIQRDQGIRLPDVMPDRVMA